MYIIDDFLNRIPMYRLALYYLVVVWFAAIGAGALRFVPYSPMRIALSGIFLFAVCNLANEIFAWAFEVPTNHESASITALILALIMPPASGVAALLALAITGLIAIGSKYYIAIQRKHLFNPAAFAAVVMGIAFNVSASWWVGTAALAPIVAIGGFFLVRQIARLDLVMAFMAIALVGGTSYYLATGQGSLFSILEQIGINSPFLFLGFAMLTEPLTLPPTRYLRIAYAAIVAALFLPFIHVGSFYFTPELGLLIGNLFVFAVSPSGKLAFKFVQKNRLSKDLYEFVFEPPEAVPHRAGQYLEWQLDDVGLDGKGNRRYLTIASSPEEYDVRIAVRIDEHASAFKRRLMQMREGDVMYGAQLAGDFTLPRDAKKKLAFIAGGIGITPFRSMVSHMMDTNDARPASLIYAGRAPHDFAFWQLLEEARAKIGLETHYIASRPDSVWKGPVGYVDAQYIRQTLPDYLDRTFYISGSGPMVASTRAALRELGVSRLRIKTDYFPGVA